MNDRYPKHTLEMFPGFIWIGYLDEINGRSVMKTIELFIDLSATHKISRFISDSRGCALDYPVMERYEVGKYWAEKVSPDIFVASIVDESHWSGLVENVASNRGGRNLLATTDKAKALEWIRSR